MKGAIRSIAVETAGSAALIATVLAIRGAGRRLRAALQRPSGNDLSAVPLEDLIRQGETP